MWWDLLGPDFAQELIDQAHEDLKTWKPDEDNLDYWRIYRKERERKRRLKASCARGSTERETGAC